MSNNVTINLAEPLVKFANGKNSIYLECELTDQIPNQLKNFYPELGKVILNNNELNGFVSLVVNGIIHDINSKKELKEEDQISLLCSVSGG